MGGGCSRLTEAVQKEERRREQARSGRGPDESEEETASSAAQIWGFFKLLFSSGNWVLSGGGTSGGERVSARKHNFEQQQLGIIITQQKGQQVWRERVRARASEREANTTPRSPIFRGVL